MQDHPVQACAQLPGAATDRIDQLRPVAHPEAHRRRPAPSGSPPARRGRRPGRCRPADPSSACPPDEMRAEHPQVLPARGGRDEDGVDDPPALVDGLQRRGRVVIGDRHVQRRQHLRGNAGWAEVTGSTRLDNGVSYRLVRGGRAARRPACPGSPGRVRRPPTLERRRGDREADRGHQDRRTRDPGRPAAIGTARAPGRPGRSRSGKEALARRASPAWSTGSTAAAAASTNGTVRSDR